MTSRWRSGLRRALRRRLPHGRCGPAAWLARGPAASRHRALWWVALPVVPRPLFVVLEAALWLRWTSWSAWIASARVARRLEPSPGARRRAASIRLLGLALGWGVPPLQAVRLGLHERPEAVDDFVLDHEADAWHRLHNARAGDAAAAALLHDKLAFAAAATAAGLPVVDTGRTVDAPAAIGFEEAVGTMDSVFCKPRVGNRGEGAFAAWREAGAWNGRHADGRPIADAQAVGQAWRALRGRGDTLLQPLLRDAPDVAAWHAASGGEAGEVATVRVITRRDVDGQAAVRCVAAWLELRIGVPGAWLPCPIDVRTGRWRLPDEPLDFPVVRAAIEALRGSCGGAGVLAGWPAMVDGSRAAHVTIGGLWAVAWDWVQTGQGARLLEGNAGFSLLALQRETGGLLAGPGQAGWPSRSR